MGAVLLVSGGVSAMPARQVFIPEHGRLYGREQVTKIADAMFDLANHHGRNDFLTVNEMNTFLRGTEGSGFLHWIMCERRRRFRRYDKDHDGRIHYHEMQRAVCDFFDEAQHAPEAWALKRL